VTRGAGRTGAWAVALALLLRLGLALATSDRVVADVARYQKVADHLLGASWNPYETKRLYPYPPPWAAVEAAAGWAARRDLLPFALAVKLPVIAADALIVALLAGMARAGRASRLAPWLYAVHPVSLLVGGVHGQFDAIPLALALVAVERLAGGRRDASALALAGAIATKSFPILLLPFLAFGRGVGPRSGLRYVILALAPGVLLLLPFAVADLPALSRELFGYSGVADFGWTALARGGEWLATGRLPRSEARFWPAAAVASKVLFLAAWGAALAAARLERLRLEAGRLALLVLVAFVTLYGLLSAQYLLWVVPLGLVRPTRPAAAFAAAATAGLVGFYLFLAPGVLAAPLEPAALERAGSLWAAGVAATLLAAAAWLVALLREGLRGLRAATAAA
jgi:hypothetical protein